VFVRVSKFESKVLFEFIFDFDLYAFSSDFGRASSLNLNTCGKVNKTNIRPDKGIRITRNVPYNDTDFVHGGMPTEGNEHPWHCSISIQSDKRIVYLQDICGATLISEQFVLTGKLFSINKLYFL
jgi:Trypsin